MKKNSTIIATLLLSSQAIHAQEITNKVDIIQTNTTDKSNDEQSKNLEQHQLAAPTNKMKQDKSLSTVQIKHKLLAHNDVHVGKSN